MNSETIAFIGAGNMATSLIGGLIADGYPAEKIWAACPKQEELDALAENFNVHTTLSNDEAVNSADIVVFAVKPQIMPTAVASSAKTLQNKKPLIISIAAGIPISHMHKWLDYEAAIVRCMPNTPALLKTGATGLFATPNVTEQQKDLAETILRAVGMTRWVADEALMDVVTALSGSGPAYFFLVMEALQQGAEDLGLPEEDARLLTLQTALGAARMAIESADSLTTLRKKVTSPGGTTEAAINTLESDDVQELFVKALQAATQRGKELADMLE